MILKIQTIIMKQIIFNLIRINKKIKFKKINNKKKILIKISFQFNPLMINKILQPKTIIMIIKNSIFNMKNPTMNNRI